MAMVVYWYDFICFGIVMGAFIGSLWVVWRNELAMNQTLHVSQLWSSCWKGLHPGWLLLIRLLSFTLMLLFLYWDILKWDKTIFVYYTEWTFTLVIVYFAVGSVISAYGCWVWSKKDTDHGENEDLLRGDVEQVLTNSYGVKEVKRDTKYAQDELRQRAGFWGYLMQITYQICGGAVIFTDIVFWCVLVPFLSNSHLGLNLLMGCMHTLNAVFLLLDTALNNLPFPWFRIAYFVQWSCLYVVFQWIIHACGFTWWPYPFLELQTPWAPLWYFSMAVVHIPCYGIYALIVRAKNSILPRLFPHRFLRSN
ncbi:uncharacterized protein LOC110820627 isoform X1 [Carica papaya]|uniref:uncharacterized protein LOC110820627 isoform X1 n=1 Tax=Carica papaya TaxID=3649 RepID=UPI000B8CEAE0|nr:uncharacterized protein LOC110820627 isoform X1 [Carica papaya]